jgi:hypothetical protein
MTDPAWFASIEALHAEASGVLTLGIFYPEDSAELLAAAAMGDELAAGLLGALLESRRRVRDAPRDKPGLCCGCPRPIRKVSPETIFGLVFPAIARPTAAVGFVFCSRCAADRKGLLAKAENRLRKLWPELRPIVVSHPAGGRA